MKEPEVLAHLKLLDPPSKYFKKHKKPKYDDDKGKLILGKDYYLTNNIFFGNSIHWSTQYEIINFAKDWLYLRLLDLPKIVKCRIDIVYHHPTDNWDLDNKGAFWLKMILDILKTPTEKQHAKAKRYNSYIKTVNCIPDDTVRYVTGYSVEYNKGVHCLEIKITGFLDDFGKQEKLFQ
jgi:hypothetical protein